MYLDNDWDEASYLCVWFQAYSAHREPERLEVGSRNRVPRW